MEEVGGRRQRRWALHVAPLKMMGHAFDGATDAASAQGKSGSKADLVPVEASGLVPAVLATVAIANSAAGENKWTTAIALGAILAFFAWALFVKGLALPLPVWSK